jgi:2,5-diketo-D-gluconate reductase B
LTTKVWVANYAKGAFAASVDASLRKLRTDYIDLLLLHWPYPSVPLGEQIAGLNAAVKAGNVRHIGVSNFNRRLLAEAIRLSEAPIVTNQFECHPYLNQRLLIDECRHLGVSVTAYCGMAVGRVFDDPALLGIARWHAKTVAQIVLRGLIQQDGVVALSRTTNPARIPANLDVSGFELSPEEMRAISHFAISDSRSVSPTGLSPAWDPTPELEA